MWVFAFLLVGGGAWAQAQTAESAKASTLFVARRGWHVDVGFAVDELTEPLGSIAAAFPGARYLFFGFGDRRYLTAKHRGAPVLLRALWPGPGLLLVTALRAPPGAAFGDAAVIQLSVAGEGALRAQAFVWQSLTERQKATLLASASKEHVASASGEHAAAGIPGPYIVPGPYEGSAFFETRDTYSAVHTCNTWAAQVLGTAGIPARSGGVVFAGQLWNQLKKAP